MIRTLSFVELSVRDWAASVRWYADLLGRPPALRAEDTEFALFEVGAARLALKGGEPGPGGVLLAFEVDGLAAALERLAALGVDPEGEAKVSPEGYRRVLLHDPDGYRLSLFEWCRPPGEPGG